MCRIARWCVCVCVLGRSLSSLVFLQTEVLLDHSLTFSPSAVYFVKHFVQQVGATPVVISDRFHSFHIHGDVLVCKNVFMLKGR